MPGKTKSSERQKAAYKRYRDEKRRDKNKESKLMRHLLKHPNDKQSEERRPVASYGNPKKSASKGRR